VTHLLWRLSVDHGPFVQTEASKLYGPGGRRQQEAPDEPKGVRASREKGLQVHASGAIGVPVELPPSALAGTFELDPGTRMPAAQLCRAMGLGREQEVLEGMSAGIVPPLEMSGGDGVDPGVMRGLERAPLVLRESVRHGRQG